jgi:hypothetical protein
VRVLFSTTAGSGHFGPLIPFARACRDAGHDVEVAAPASFAAAVLAAGLDHVPFADVPPEVIEPIRGRLPELSFEAANETVLAEIFGRLGARAALPGVTEIVDQWHPDIVVREPAEFASLVVAERAGIGQVQVAIGMGGGADFALPILASPLRELSVIAGLPADRAMTTLLTTPGFSSVPAGLDDAVAPEAGPVWRFRDASVEANPSSLPPPWGDPDDPLVYVTFGSVTAGIGPFASLYPATLDALADLSVRVLMTTGTAGDPEMIAVPPNAHVERWWPQAAVMPHAAAVVGHGGFGTTMFAVAAGVPQVVVPLFAFDQTINAERIAASGAGIHLPGGPAAVPEIPSAIAAVLTEDRYRERARVLAAEIARLPDVAESVTVLEELANR